MKTAVVAARGLGDGLLSMVLAHNLVQAGDDVTCFSSPLCQLKKWFPNCRIEPAPQPEGFRSVFTPYDRLIVADHACVTDEHDFGNEIIILKESAFDRRLSMVDNLLNVCSNQLEISYPSPHNGIVAPIALTWKKHEKRVIIHPTSTSEKKNWSPNKFIQLGYRLKDEGYEPAFTVSPHERREWEVRLRETGLALPLFERIDDLAAFVYESGSMIGNDSGVGHLASCLKLPTLSLFARNSYARLWRPGWGNNSVVTPLPLLFGAGAKEKYWRALLSPRRVLREYKKKWAGPR